MIAVKSCQNDLARGDHNVIRSTWGSDAWDLGVSVKFFVGQRQIEDRRDPRDLGSKLESDEVLLSVKDDYNSLPFKTREICARMAGKMISGLFICDTDTFIDVEKLLASGMENYDYAGFFFDKTKGTFPYDAIDRDGNVEHHDETYNWASGGRGYYLSPAAFEMVADSYPTSWAEDLWVGQVIGPEVAAGTMSILNLRGQAVSKHFPAAKFQSNYNEEDGHRWMRERYAEVHPK